MTDQEKILRHDTLEILKQRIGGCFGTTDRIFAGYPNDEKGQRNYVKWQLITKLRFKKFVN